MNGVSFESEAFIIIDEISGIIYHKSALQHQRISRMLGGEAINYAPDNSSNGDLELMSSNTQLPKIPKTWTLVCIRNESSAGVFGFTYMFLGVLLGLIGRRVTNLWVLTLLVFMRHGYHIPLMELQRTTRAHCAQ